MDQINEFSSTRRIKRRISDITYLLVYISTVICIHGQVTDAVRSTRNRSMQVVGI
jgi:hypothetical protein